MIDTRVYLVTDDPSRYAGDWLDNVIAAVEGGVTCVQYRDTESAPREQYERLLRLRDALAPRGTPLIVNNDAELAKAVQAEGVHVGQSDLAPEAVRAIVGPRCAIGLSITAADQLVAAATAHVRGAVDILGIGPVFDARKTKADASEAMGTTGLRTIVEAVLAGPLSDVGRVAIGGITCANAADVLAAGAEGLAVVSAFSQSENSHEVARSFSMLFDRRRV